MKNQKAITLIALIITIIVMLILAGIVISLVIQDDGVLNQAQVAGKKQLYAMAEEKIRTQCQYITEGENVGKVDLSKTESNITQMELEEIKSIISTPNLLTVELNDGSKIEIEGANGRGELNEYGFYYNTPYNLTKIGSNNKKSIYSIRLESNGDFIANVIEADDVQEGQSFSIRGIGGNTILDIDSVEYNKKYYDVKGEYNSEYVIEIDSNGNLLIEMIIKAENLKISNKTVEFIGENGSLIKLGEFSEDGKSHILNTGEIFKID